MNRLLSKREEQVLKLLLAGFMQKQIAQELEISESRVQDVKSIIKKKWEVNTEIDFILAAIRLGYLIIEGSPIKAFAKYTSNSTEESRFNYIYSPSRHNKVRVIFD
jgi:DNA-binding CsgD family transcriptional regulator